ncbi:hypothetical protein PoB_004298500 [Plakobranchus ocellatus]|uniref:Uncharacterized protein n=1 Tax=Plakobranchus ocellatus TaxID=259542 RepID=A0AAV4B7B5_9GAST|nr:hypothetical protein PoB_004298500 [Plakobranchus ocellatus]
MKSSAAVRAFPNNETIITLACFSWLERAGCDIMQTKTRDRSVYGLGWCSKNLSSMKGRGGERQIVGNPRIAHCPQLGQDDRSTEYHHVGGHCMPKC